jgi:hypothetical protein
MIFIECFQSEGLIERIQHSTLSARKTKDNAMDILEDIQKHLSFDLKGYEEEQNKMYKILNQTKENYASILK